MPRREPEPATRPLLVGPLMPPLVPPTFEEMMLAYHARVARVGRLWLVFCEFIHVDIAQCRELVEHLQALLRLDARIHGHYGFGHGRRLLDGLLRLGRRRRGWGWRRLHDQLHHSLGQ